MSASSVLTLRLDPKLKNQLDRLSKSMNRSRSFVAAQAIQEYVSVNEWQIGEIKKGLAEADAGDFATDEEMQQTIRRLMVIMAALLPFQETLVLLSRAAPALSVVDVACGTQPEPCQCGRPPANRQCRGWRLPARARDFRRQTKECPCVLASRRSERVWRAACYSSGRPLACIYRTVYTIPYPVKGLRAAPPSPFPALEKSADHSHRGPPYSSCPTSDGWPRSRRNSAPRGHRAASSGGRSRHRAFSRKCRPEDGPTTNRLTAINVCCVLPHMRVYTMCTLPALRRAVAKGQDTS